MKRTRSRHSQSIPKQLPLPGMLDLPYSRHGEPPWTFPKIVAQIEADIRAINAMFGVPEPRSFDPVNKASGEANP